MNDTFKGRVPAYVEATVNGEYTDVTITFGEKTPNVSNADGSVTVTPRAVLQMRDHVPHDVLRFLRREIEKPQSMLDGAPHLVYGATLEYSRSDEAWLATIKKPLYDGTGCFVIGAGTSPAAAFANFDACWNSGAAADVPWAKGDIQPFKAPKLGLKDVTMQLGEPMTGTLSFNCAGEVKEFTKRFPRTGLPEVGSIWQHYSGRRYEVICIANADSTRTKYPATIVYRGENGKIWSRRADDWHRSMIVYDNSNVYKTDGGVFDAARHATFPNHDVEQLKQRILELCGECNSRNDQLIELERSRQSLLETVEALELKVEGAQQEAVDARRTTAACGRNARQLQERIDELDLSLEEALDKNNALHQQHQRMLSFCSAKTAEDVLKYAVAVARAMAFNDSANPFEIEFGTDRKEACYVGDQKTVITMASATLVGKRARELKGQRDIHEPMEVMMARAWLKMFPLNPA